MTFLDKLTETVRRQQSLLCIGLDSELSKLPAHLRSVDEPLFAFNKAVIDATAEFAAAFKVNLAFYEAYGLEGWSALKKTFSYLPKHVIRIADAKRGDIGNTARLYAQALFEELDADAVTVNPYMGSDSVDPFLQREEKGVFVLCLTSNAGSADFQRFSDGSRQLYEKVALNVREWNVRGNCGLVVGSTHPLELAHVRKLVPDLPLLIPGIGAQGGDVQASVAAVEETSGAPVLFNSSRAILYASSGADFAEAAAQAARQTRDLLNKFRKTNHF
ncbi:MAG: orotidine-5'-phosphate decarboxylase [candidate division KSB1 bacterium]|nr:orotidine-5'-phosphate decarboxylase [candidate division KSB1 bacterium]